MTAEPKPSMKTFQVMLRAPRDADDATAIRALRAILKIAWRRYRLCCISAHEVPDPPDDPGRP
jgi:hypothetical protein